MNKKIKELKKYLDEMMHHNNNISEINSTLIYNKLFATSHNSHTLDNYTNQKSFYEKASVSRYCYRIVNEKHFDILLLQSYRTFVSYAIIDKNNNIIAKNTNNKWSSTTTRHQKAFIKYLEEEVTK